MTDVAALVEAQGVGIDLEDDDLVSGVVLLAKVIAADGEVSLTIGASDGMSWLDQLGLIAAADAVCREGGFRHKDDD